jgi:hypothetical protein
MNKLTLNIFLKKDFTDRLMLLLCILKLLAVVPQYSLFWTLMRREKRKGERRREDERERGGEKSICIYFSRFKGMIFFFAPSLNFFHLPLPQTLCSSCQCFTIATFLHSNKTLVGD